MTRRRTKARQCGAAERFFAAIISGLFNLTFSYLSQQDLGRFHQTYMGSARCRRLWPTLAATAQHTGPLFCVFTSKEELRGVLFKMWVDVRGWELHLWCFPVDVGEEGRIIYRLLLRSAADE